MGERDTNMYDINGQHFNHELYYQKLLKECNLRQVMDQEADIVKDIQNLHSDMQTLVYENYNKFISATDTVRKMKTDFKKMEDEMDLLASNMDTITSFSEQISSTLQETRQKISKLSSIHSLLKRLQFLFKLPRKLKVMMEEKNYNQAVQDYMHAQRVLQQYGNMASFQGIQEDCTVIVVELKQKLRDQFKRSHATTKDLTESVDLLLQLGEPADKLCAEFLSCADNRLSEQLVLLQDLSDQKDIIEFVDLGSSGFLSDLCLVVASYNDMFVNGIHLEEISYSEEFEITAQNQLNVFVLNNMSKYFEIVQNRVDLEQDVGDTVVLVRALDRFHRRLQAMNMLCKETDFAVQGTDIVMNASRKQCKAHLHTLKIHFNDSLTKVRQSLAAPKLINQEGDSSCNMAELLSSLVLTNMEKIKGVLQDLLVFIQPDITFSLKTQFRETFCIDSVREGLVVGFIHHLTATVRGFCESQTCSDPRCPPSLLLLLSKMCLEFQNNSIHSLLLYVDELFEIGQHSPGILTPEAELCKSMQDSAQQLLNYYVRLLGHNVSQMLRKSVETRDWLHTIEPRTVRAVMKRVVEDIAAVDTTVGVLFEDGTRTEHSSDSSRKTHSISVSRHQFRSNWSSYTPNQLDSSIVTNIHKLFSERIEIFSNVEFSKNSILTGIIKISLKTFLECVRLKTFSKYGLQQIQVDTHYLQLYLWRFVADENLVHFLLDEILGSAVHRCLDPVLMEPSVVEIICERG